MSMKPSQGIQSSLPDDIVLKIVSLLQVQDVCALGSCCRFWRESCESDCIWEFLAKERWPSLSLFNQSRTLSPTQALISKGWRRFYIKRHKEIAGMVAVVTESMEKNLLTGSLEVGDYLKAVGDLCTLHLGFKDVQMLLFKLQHNVLINLVGLHYCMYWLGVPGEKVVEALQSCKISKRGVCIKWWKLGRLFYGFRMRDESHSRRVSLEDFALAKEQEALVVLQRGAIYEVLRVQISAADPPFTP